MFGGDPVLASAALDRLLHRCTVLNSRDDWSPLQASRSNEGSGQHFPENPRPWFSGSSSDLQVHNLINADEAFLSTTPYCLMPVSHINGIAIGGEVPGPVYRRLMEAWSEEVGLDIRAQIREGAKRRQG